MPERIPLNSNSIILTSSNRSQIAPSVYGTPTTEIDISRDYSKVTSSSQIYCDTQCDSIVNASHIGESRYCDPATRPLLSAQNSVLALKPTVWRPYDDRNSIMQVYRHIKIYIGTIKLQFLCGLINLTLCQIYLFLIAAENWDFPMVTYHNNWN